MQRANTTVQQGKASYNAGWAENSARQSAAVTNDTNQAGSGISPCVDSSARTTMLSQYPVQGQTHQSGGNTDAWDAQGTYAEQWSRGWTPGSAERGCVESGDMLRASLTTVVACDLSPSSEADMWRCPTYVTLIGK